MLLSAEHILFTYGTKPLLTDVSLYLNSGDKLGIIGINGTGKSTLLRILAGKTHADAGVIACNPNVQVSFLEQNPVMHDEMTVLEQIFAEFPPEFRTLKEYEAVTMPVPGDRILYLCGVVLPVARAGKRERAVGLQLPQLFVPVQRAILQRHRFFLPTSRNIDSIRLNSARFKLNPAVFLYHKQLGGIAVIQLLLAIIYLAFISLGLPDSLLGAAWPSMYPSFDVPVSFAGIVSMIIAVGTIVSSLQSDRLTRVFGAGKVTAVSVALTAFALFGFSLSHSFWPLCLWAIPYGLGAGSVDAALNNYVALHFASRHMAVTLAATLLQISVRTALVYLWVPRYGITGEAWACLIGWICQFVYEYGLYFRERNRIFRTA